ncbi:MAG: recombinase family protein [Clostridiales bacterium]|jgi:site-specific DNA recombinase|nr:recombinase family protein [Clostridiales bacterium]
MARKKERVAADDRRVAIYVRKSKITESGKGIEIQKERCASLARSHFDAAEGDILIYEDEGKSGFYADRPRYRAMLKDIEADKIKAVICYKIDRISRRTVDLLNLVQQMQQKGVAFVSVSDRELDTSSKTGKIMISMLSAIAEFERDIIAERIADNMYELAKEGRWLGGKCPLGYRSQKETTAVNGRKTRVNHLAPVEEGQRAVKRLFELFLQTSSLKGTAARLNDEGHKTGTGNSFTPVAVKNILQNPVYAVADADMRGYFMSFGITVWADAEDFDGARGIMAYNKTEQFKEIDRDSKALDPKYTQRMLRRDIKDWVVSVGKHRGIISGADWIKAQGLIADISKNHTARPKGSSKALLSGLVRCVDCGGPMFVRTEGGRYNPDGSLRFRYVCDVKYRKKGGCESSPNVKGYELDNFVIGQICGMDKQEDALYDELLGIKKALQMRHRGAKDEQAALKKRLSQIEADIQGQALNLRDAPDGAKQAIYRDIEILGGERDEAQSRLDAMCRESKRREDEAADISKAKRVIMDFPRMAELARHESKLQLLRRIVESVVVRDDTVHIFLKGAFGNIAVSHSAE